MWCLTIYICSMHGFRSAHSESAVNVFSIAVYMQSWAHGSCSTGGNVSSSIVELFIQSILIGIESFVNCVLNHASIKWYGSIQQEIVANCHNRVSFSRIKQQFPWNMISHGILALSMLAINLFQFNGNMPKPKHQSAVPLFRLLLSRMRECCPTSIRMLYCFPCNAYVCMVISIAY